MENRGKSPKIKGFYNTYNFGCMYVFADIDVQYHIQIINYKQQTVLPKIKD
jgi:hypothetical protein